MQVDVTLLDTGTGEVVFEERSSVLYPRLLKLFPWLDKSIMPNSQYIIYLRFNSYKLTLQTKIPFNYD